MATTIDYDESRPRHLWHAREYQVGSHPAITEETGPFPSYSTVAGLYNNTAALMAWAAKTNSAHYAAALAALPAPIKTEDAIAVIADTGPYRRETKAAGDIGTDMHERFQELLTGRRAKTVPTLTEGEARTILALQSWIKEMEYLQLTGEEIVADPRHRTAGRYDSIGSLNVLGGRRNVLVDLKTGKSVKPSGILQVAGYWGALVFAVKNLIDAAIILHAPIGCDRVTPHILSLSDLEEHYRAFFAVRQLWDWHVKHGGLK